MSRMTAAVSDLIQAAILPAGWIVGLLLAVIVLLWRGRRRAALIGAFVALTLFWMLSTPIVAAAILRPLEAEHEGLALPSDQVAVVVVLAGGPDQSASGRLTLGGVALLRLQRGLEIVSAYAGTVPLLYVGALPDEAGLVQALGAARHLPAGTVNVETASTNTFEGAVATQRWIAARGRSNMRVILVTSGWHMRRSLATFRRQGISVVPASSDDRAIIGPTKMPAWLPSASAFETSSAGIREWIGLFQYRLRGRL